MRFLLPLLLAGCANAPVQTFEVPVPVPVPCSAPIPSEPSWALDSVAPDADIDTLMKAALAELEQRRGYQKQLTAAVRGCRGEP